MITSDLLDSVEWYLNVLYVTDRAQKYLNIHNRFCLFVGLQGSTVGQYLCRGNILHCDKILRIQFAAKGKPCVVLRLGSDEGPRWPVYGDQYISPYKSWIPFCLVVAHHRLRVSCSIGQKCLETGMGVAEWSADYGAVTLRSFVTSILHVWLTALIQGT